MGGPLGGVCCGALAAVLVGGATALGAPAPAAAAIPLQASQPAALVNPFAGTGTGATSPGSIGEFPGADTPFGMIQWSPDTTPDRIPGSGYSYADSRITGLSLTHMSGTGCASYGDVPILPTTGPIGADPVDTSASFSHDREFASPGRYEVSLGSPPVLSRLAVTTRTGLAQFTFPRTASANLLFKLGASANGTQAASVHVVGDDALAGQVTSGQFCGTGTNYTVYFVARFNHPFASKGTWDAAGVLPGGSRCTGAACGAYVTFDASSKPTVSMKVGISFVSEEGAARNLASEDPGWDLAGLEAQARARWDEVLGRIRVSGGSYAEQRTFYTALYHSLLHPNVVSDVDGSYIGENGKVHEASGRAQYANFSEWDIYRSEIELISLVAPQQASGMIQSLVSDAGQAGWLPKWAIVGGDASQMNGDSADPIIAAAYAFGVRGFDEESALHAMVKGADEQESPHGLEIERQYLDQYLAKHYVDASALDLDSIDYSVGASMTLEYAIDDFSIAQLARSLGRYSLATTMMRRAHSWEYLFNPAMGYIQGRNADGSFPAGPAFNPALFEDGGEQGFEEGNAIQYTWSVPQDLEALGLLMGGNSSVVEKLDAFFSQLNAGRYAPYDWAGNEPSLWTAWEYDWFGSPAKTQALVREVATTLYGDTPVDEPGNDDLGAISSWYVWAALGLYPVTPGTANLALASPLFHRAEVTLPDGHELGIDALKAAPDRPYVQALRVTGTSVAQPSTGCPPSGRVTRRSADAWRNPWLPARILQTGATLSYTLSAVPSPTWGTGPTSRPPSYGEGRLPAVGFSQPSGSLSLQAGVPGSFEIGVKQVVGGGPGVVWNATATNGIALSQTKGTFRAASAPGCASPPAVTKRLTVTAPSTGTGTVDIAMRTTAGTDLPPVVVNVVSASP